MLPEIAILPDVFSAPAVADRHVYADVIALLDRARGAAFLSALCDGELRKEMVRRATALEDHRSSHVLCELLSRLHHENCFIERATASTWPCCDQDWLEEARSVAEGTDLAAVIATRASLDSVRAFRKCHAAGEGLAEVRALMDSCVSTQFVKDEEGIRSTFSGLFARVKSVQVVDPYLFATSDANVDAHRAGLLALARACSGRRAVPLNRFVLHTAWRDRDGSLLQREVGRVRAGLLPLRLGVPLRVEFWEQKDGGPRLHDRFVVTERVALRVGNSFDIRHEETGCSVLTRRDHCKIAADYQINSPTFRHVKSVEI